ncbi:hypothetical protein SteCoe_10528 [Stentor coeruleus]|uniref:GRIP domain-containing protein n=1 Tax=Stentor coeruleus TaxID=5963 RepID=A0A1R2CF94_9CILI|nr:hypothetical protein SteCoe_10528 [Stentor coeruleus]
MLNFNSLANLAVGTINFAKKNIQESNFDDKEEYLYEKHIGSTCKKLNKRCEKLKCELVQKYEEIDSYKKIIESLYKEKTDWEANKINFKIVIGHERSKEVNEELMKKNSEVLKLKLPEKSYQTIDSLTSAKLSINHIDDYSIPQSCNIKTIEKQCINAEKTILRISKEKENIFKILVKKDEKIKSLLENAKIHEEEKSLLMQIKENGLKNLENLKFLNDFKENAEKKIESLTKILESTQEYNQKLLVKKYDLRTKVYHMSKNLKEKDGLIKNLQEELDDIKNELDDKVSCFEEYRLTSEKNIKEVSELLMKQAKDERDRFEEMIYQLKDQLMKARIEANETVIAKNQSSKYQKAVEKLQEVIKTVELESSSIQSRLDKTTSYCESLKQKLENHNKTIENLQNINESLKNELKLCKNQFEIERQAFISKANERDDIKKEAELLLKKLESQDKVSINMIDKRLVANTLINYLDENTNQKMKNHMLRALAEILGLDQRQREKIGLTQSQSFLSGFTNYISRI